MNRNLCSPNNFWGTYFFEIRHFSTILVSALFSSCWLSNPPEQFNWEEHLQGVSGLWSSKQGSPEALTWRAKLGSEVRKFLQDFLEPEPGIRNGCLAQVGPISSKVLIRIVVTTRKVKYIVFLWLHCPVKAAERRWESFHVRCGNKAWAELWAEPCNQLGGKN